jgi:hypothetical protein
MICVFGSFVIGDPLRILDVFGFGLAVAILVDATLVRMVLAPSLAGPCDSRLDVETAPVSPVSPTPATTGLIATREMTRPARRNRAAGPGPHRPPDRRRPTLEGDELHGLPQLPCGRYQHDHQRVQIDRSHAGFVREFRGEDLFRACRTGAVVGFSLVRRHWTRNGTGKPVSGLWLSFP